MRSFFCKLLPTAALFLLCAGCVNVDYIGQTFDSIPEGTPVEYFDGRTHVPAGKYRIIGRAKISTLRNLDYYDIRELLVDEARKRGSDAVVLVKKKNVLRGIYQREPSFDPGKDIAPALKSNNLTPDGRPLDIPVGGQVVIKGEHNYRSEIELYVLFLKDKDDLEQQLARRGRELDRLVKQPDPADLDPAKKARKSEKN